MSEDKLGKECAEAQTKTHAPEESDLVGVINYLREREANLSNYSDKLRQNLVTIDDKIVKLKISKKIVDIERFAVQSDGDERLICYLVVSPASFNPKFAGLWILATPFDANKNFEDAEMYGKYIAFQNASRETLKTLVQSGRLHKFLKYAAHKLAEAEQEYKAVAEAAEKMAAPLQ